MTHKTFYQKFEDNISHMRDYVRKIDDLENLLGADIWEGLIGNLFDDLYQLNLAPYTDLVEEDRRDEAIEALSELIYDFDVSDESFRAFAEEFLKGYLD